MKRRLPVIILLVIAAAVLIWWLFGRSESERYLSGYIEGEELYLAAPLSGTVQAIAAKEGSRVRAGTALFAIDPATLSAQGDQARAEALSRTRFRGGLVTYSEVLTNQGKRLSVEKQMIETRGALARDSVALFKALGGGWPEQQP